MASMGLVQIHFCTYTDAANFDGSTVTKRIRNQFYPRKKLSRRISLESGLKAWCRGDSFRSMPYYSGFRKIWLGALTSSYHAGRGVDAKDLRAYSARQSLRETVLKAATVICSHDSQAKVHQLTLEFARRGGKDLDLSSKEFNAPFDLGLN
jgi:hypothetical protein